MWLLKNSILRKSAETRSYQEALRTIFAALLDIFDLSIYSFVQKTDYFNTHSCFDSYLNAGQCRPVWPAPRCRAAESLLTGLVLRRLFVKSGKEQFRRCRRVDRTIDDDVFGADSLPVQPTVTIAIRAKR